MKKNVSGARKLPGAAQLNQGGNVEVWEKSG